MIKKSNQIDLEKIKYLIINGSNMPEKNSNTYKICDFVYQTLSVKPNIVNIISYKLYAFDFIDNTVFQSQKYHEYNSFITQFQKIVLVFPEYHGSLPANTKIFFDYMKQNLLENCIVMLIVVNGGNFSNTSQEHATTIINKLGGWVYPKTIHFTNSANVNFFNDQVTQQYIKKHIELFYLL